MLAKENLSLKKAVFKKTYKKSYIKKVRELKSTEKEV